MKINKPKGTWTEKKSRRLHWDENQPSDAWEDQMRKDCAEVLVLDGKRKKVRRNSPSYKKPLPRTMDMTLGELVEVATARGVTQIFVEFKGSRFSLRAIK